MESPRNPSIRPLTPQGPGRGAQAPCLTKEDPCFIASRVQAPSEISICHPVFEKKQSIRGPEAPSSPPVQTKHLRHMQGAGLILVFTSVPRPQLGCRTSEGARFP